MRNNIHEKRIIEQIGMLSSPRADLKTAAWSQAKKSSADSPIIGTVYKVHINVTMEWLTLASTGQGGIVMNCFIEDLYIQSRAQLSNNDIAYIITRLK